MYAQYMFNSVLTLWYHVSGVVIIRLISSQLGALSFTSWNDCKPPRILLTDTCRLWFMVCSWQFTDS